MPYYSWKGVNLHAEWCKGKLFARNESELDEILFKKDIALHSVCQKKLWSTRVKQQEVLNYFIQLHTLSKAGVRIPEALNSMASYPESPYFSSVCNDVADQVAQGISLAVALAKHPHVFNPIAVQIIDIGLESGSLPQSLGVLVHHLESVSIFKKRLKAAFLLPAVTFIFFLLIIAIVLVVIVPQFVSLCATMGKQLPESTQLLLNISNLLRNPKLFLGIGIVSLVSLLALRHQKPSSKKEMLYTLFSKVPLFKKLILFQILAVYFRSTAQLLQGGMPLAKSLAISAESVEYSEIKDQLRYVAWAVDSGVAFKDSLSACVDLLDQNCLALICVGQETGKLADMLLRIADEYQERLLSQMHRITTLAQPFLLVILGLLIGMLILGLYAPIMSLSSVI